MAKTNDRSYFSSVKTRIFIKGLGAFLVGVLILLTSCSKTQPTITMLNLGLKAINLVQNGNPVDLVTSDASGEFKFQIVCSPSLQKIEFAASSKGPFVLFQAISCVNGLAEMVYKPTSLTSAPLYLRTVGELGPSEAEPVVFAYGGQCALTGAPTLPTNPTKNPFTLSLSGANCPIVGVGGVTSGVTGFYYAVGAASSTNCHSVAMTTTGGTRTSLAFNSTTDPASSFPEASVRICARLKTSTGLILSGEDTIETMFNHDTVAPTVALTTPASLYVNNSVKTSYPLSGACNDATGTVSVKVWQTSTPTNFVTKTDIACSGSSWSTNVDVSSFPEGSVTVRASIIDLALNSANSPSDLVLTKDTVAPTITGVDVDTSILDGYKPAGTVLTLNMTWSENINLNSSGGSPTLLLNITPAGRIATLINNTNNITKLTYTVQNGDTSADLDYASDSALVANGAIFQDLAGNAATLTLPLPGAAASIAGQGDVIIDTTPPGNFSLSGITTPAGSQADRSVDAYLAKVSSVTNVEINFSDSVGASKFKVEVFDSPSGGNLKCSVPNLTGAGVVSVPKASCFPTTADGTIYYIELTASDAAGNITLAGNAKTGARYLMTIDTTVPQVTGISIISGTDANGTDGFLTNVANNTLTVAFGTQNTDSVVIKLFRVGYGTSICESSVINAPAMSGNSEDLTSCAGISTNLDYRLDFLASKSTGTSNTVSAFFKGDWTNPILAITTPTAGSYINGSNKAAFTISGSCDEDTRTVTIKKDGTSIGTATCTTAANPDFTKTVDASLWGESTSGYSLTAEMSDAAGNIGTSSAISVKKDTSAPTATLVTASLPVSLSNATSFSISVAGTDVTAYRYKLGTGTTKCLVGDGAYGTETAVGTSISKTISEYAQIAQGQVYVCVIGRDDAGNWQSDTSATSYSWTKDTLPPTISKMAKISSDANPFGVSGVINFRVDWSENVVINTGEGSPTLDLATTPTLGTATLSASNVNGGSNVTLLTHTVLAGQNSMDLEYPNTSSLKLNGSIIKDSAGNDATLTLPTIGGGSSLSDIANYVIDTTPPADFNLTGITTGGSDATLDAYLTDLSQSMVRINFDSSAGASTYSITVYDSGDVQKCQVGSNTSSPAPVTKTTCFPITTNGTQYKIKIVASDLAGNTKEASNASALSPYFVTIDSANPVITNIGITADTDANGTDSYLTATNGDGSVVVGFSQDIGDRADIKVLNAAQTVTICSLMNQTIADGANSFPVSGCGSLADGTSYVISITAKRTTPPSQGTTTKTFSVDKTAPTLAIGVPSNNSYINSTTLNKNAYVVSGSCSENGRNVDLYIDGAGTSTATFTCNTGSTPNFSFTIDTTSGGLNWSQAAHTLQVKQTDLAGWTGLSSLVTVTKDTSVPAPTISTPLASAYVNDANKSSFTISGTCETGRSVALWVGGVDSTQTASCLTGSFTMNADATSASIWPSGSLTLTVKQTDAAGNTGTSSGVNITKDISVPTVALTSPAANSYINAANQTSMVFSGTCNENGAAVTIKAGSTTIATPTCNGTNTFSSGTKDVSAWADGAYSITATIQDAAGNSSISSAVNITMDTSTPAPTISTPVAGAYVNDANKSSFTISGTCETGLSVALWVGSVDSTQTASCLAGSFTMNADARSASIWPSGALSLTVKQTDAAGNTGTSSGVTITKDISVPTVALTSPAANSYINAANESSMVFSGTCNENGAMVTIKAGSTTIATPTCNGTTFSSGTKDVSAWSDGPYSITATIEDAAGNSSNASGLSITKDTVAPVMSTITMASTSTLLDRSPSFSWSAATGPSSELLTDINRYEVRMDGNSTWTSTLLVLNYQFVGLSLTDSVTDHTVSVRAIDNAGNISNEQTANWSVLAWPASANQTLSAGQSATAEFGTAMDISENGNIMVVGAPGYNSNDGAIFIYSWDSSTRNWQLRSTQYGVNGSGGRLGHAVSVTEAGSASPKIRIVAGAPLANSGDGDFSVYTMHETTFAVNAINLVSAPTPVNPTGAGIGTSVLAINDLIYVGIPNETWDCKSGGLDELQCGSIYYATYDAQTSNFPSWFRVQRTLGTSGYVGYKFGYAMARGNNQVWIGARREQDVGAPTPGSSALFVYGVGATTATSTLALDAGYVLEAFKVADTGTGTTSNFVAYRSNTGRSVFVKKCNGTSNACTVLASTPYGSYIGDRIALRKQSNPSYPTLLAISDLTSATTPSVSVYANGLSSFSIRASSPLSEADPPPSSSTSLFGSGLVFGNNGALIISAPAFFNGSNDYGALFNFF